MLSRVAESVYWMSRYIERAENVARFVDVNELPDARSPAGDAAAMGPPRGDHRRHGGLQQGVQRRRPGRGVLVPDIRSGEPEFDPLVRCGQRGENARSVREILTSAVWAEVNETYLYVEHHAKNRTASSHDFLQHVIRSSHGVVGATNTTLSRTEAWHFSRLGRLLERADKTTRVVDIRYFVLLPTSANVGSPTDDLHWTAVLQSVSALEMYRQKHGMVRQVGTADFLILDEQFPRSVRNCLYRADESLRAITGSPMRTFRNPAERMLGRLVAELDYALIDEVILEGLHQYLDELQRKLNDVGDAIRRAFFSPQLAADAQPERLVSE